MKVILGSDVDGNELKDYIIDLAHQLEGKSSSNKVVESTEKE